MVPSGHLPRLRTRALAEHAWRSPCRSTYFSVACSSPSAPSAFRSHWLSDQTARADARLGALTRRSSSAPTTPIPSAKVARRVTFPGAPQCRQPWARSAACARKRVPYNREPRLAPCNSSKLIRARVRLPSVSRMDRPLNSPIACRHEECAKQARAPQLMPLARRPGREYADCLGNRRLKRRLSLRHAKKRAFHGRGKLLLVGVMRQQKLP